MTKVIDHIYIFMTVIFTVYSQLIMRWQVSNAGEPPSDIIGKISYLVGLLTNPYVLSGVASTFLAGISWMLAMTKFDISYAYPFVSLNYILILIAGFFLFNEPINLTKIAGSGLVIIGIIIISKG
jgi:multidrug transporter EmrE-like cation transporter